MSDLKVLVYEVDITPHPDPDTTRLEIAHIAGYQSIVAKGSFKSGDHVAYIPEGSILPDSLIEDMGLTGKLSGKSKNRVKAVKLRKVLSQGLVYKVDDPIGTDVTERLGITKYVPRVIEAMRGEIENPNIKLPHFDVENIKMYPDVLQEGEQVVITEKLHGTFCMMGYCGDKPIVSSKGLSHKNLCLKFNEDNLKKNMYVKTFIEYKKRLDELHKLYDTFYVMGEVFGRGVQDLHYGRESNEFRMFECCTEDYFDLSRLQDIGIAMVPILYCGEYSKDLIDKYTSGQSNIALHGKEGIVIKSNPPSYFQTDAGYDKRVIFKSISEKYLLRKGGTEYN